MTTLFITQFFSANALFIWGYLYVTFNVLFSEQGFSAFMLYPIVPVCFSVYAWIEYSRGEFKRATILSSIPVALTLIILLYYFVRGVMSST
ncbi:MAG: hypothetical protein JNL32_07100 [Candidatus Kapabacteria bacterium]|nr:hypothetical protein [Candidatus Kapabacteria bacterium]